MDINPLQITAYILVAISAMLVFSAYRRQVR